MPSMAFNSLYVHTSLAPGRSSLQPQLCERIFGDCWASCGPPVNVWCLPLRVSVITAATIAPMDKTQPANVDSAAIRALNVHDAVERKAVVDLVNECYRGNKNWTNESHLVSGDRLTDKELCKEVQDMTMLVAVLMRGNEEEAIIGCIKTGIVHKTVVGALDVPAGYIGTFAVKPAYGSKGLGTRLLNAAEAFCRSQGATRMVLDVLSVRNEIMAWYKRCGYTLSSSSVPAADVIKRCGGELLVACDFVVMCREFSAQGALVDASTRRP